MEVKTWGKFDPNSQNGNCWDWLSDHARRRATGSPDRGVFAGWGGITGIPGLAAAGGAMAAADVACDAAALPVIWEQAFDA